MSGNRDLPELDRKGLRGFGITTGAILAVLFGLFFPWLLNRPWPLWPWILFAVLAGVGLVAPMALRPLYRGWMRFGLLMSRITTPLILGLVFFLLITPVSLFLRVFGRDSMRRRLERQGAESYRQPSTAKPPAQLERPF